MVANIRGYTDNYQFRLINFDTPRWHTLEYANWQQLDAMLYSAGVAQVRGEWQYNTLYLVGERVFDGQTNDVYRCLVQHTSPSTGTFAEYRANPATSGHWVLQIAGTPVYRGAWTPDTVYALGDIVHLNAYQYYLCDLNHISHADFATDVDNWQLIFDTSATIGAAEGFADAAEASATAASTSEGNASVSASQAAASADTALVYKDTAVQAATDSSMYAGQSVDARDAAQVYAGNASASATTAGIAATNAEASAIAAADQAAALKGTSTSVNEISNGLKLFETQAGKHFYPGTFLTIVNGNDTTTGLACVVEAYSGTTLQCRATGFTGTGLSDNWLIYVSGSEGLDGTPGTPGADGTDGDPGLVWKGNWNSATSYSIKDAVAHVGSSYIAMIANTNSEPPSPNWSLLAQGGSIAIVDDQVIPSNLDADTGPKQLLFRDRLNFVSRSGDQMPGPLAIGSEPVQGTEKFKVIDPSGAKLAVEFDPTSHAFAITSEAYTEITTYGNWYYDKMARGTKTVPVKLEVDDAISGRSVYGHDGVKFVPESAGIFFSVDAAVTTDNVPTGIQFHTGNGLGSANPSKQRFAIQSNGKVLLKGQDAGYTEPDQVVPKSYVDAAAAASPNAVMKNVTATQQMIGNLGITTSIPAGAFLQLINTVGGTNDWKIVNTGGDHGTAGDLFFWNNVGGTRAYFQKNGGFINMGHSFNLGNVFAGYGAEKIGTYYFGNHGGYNLNAPGNDELHINGFTVVNAPLAVLRASTLQAIDKTTPTQGVVYFGNTGVKSLYWNGGEFYFQGGDVRNADKFISTAADGIQIHAPASNNAQFISVAGSRNYGIGANSNGVFVINDNTAGLTRFHINSAGSANIYKDLTIGTNLAVGSTSLFHDDMSIRRAGNPATGLIHFGNSGLRYLFYDGARYNFVGAPTAGETPVAPQDLTTKSYVDAKVSSGAFLPLAGGNMTGKIYTGGQIHTTIAYNGSAGSVEVLGTSGAADSMLTFHRPGAFACNFGLANGNDFQYGGWSFGGVAYKIWSNAHYGAPLISTRLVYVGDYTHGMNTGLAEPYGSSTVTGGSGVNGSIFSYVLRYRQLQIQTWDGAWYAVGYA